jgi:hypothetical protein
MRDADRLARRPDQWPPLSRGAAVKVYMGCQWVSGAWHGMQGRSAAVWVGRDQRMVYVGDARNVRAAG